jgi:RNA polymerase sigma-70 factor (ECF subfamily)
VAVKTRDKRDIDDMRRLAAGDEAALKSLIRRHEKRLYNYFLRNVRNHTEAAEMTAEIFLRVYQHRRRFKFASKVSTWFHAIALNLVRTRARSQAQRQFVPLDIESEIDVSDAESPGRTNSFYRFIDSKPSPREVLQLQERLDAAYEMVYELPVKLRQAFLFFETKRLSLVQIAKRLNCSPKTVEMRLYHARRRLQVKAQKLRETV